MGEFPSGQRGQTVNLLRIASMVRIRPPPPEKRHTFRCVFFLLWGGRIRIIKCKAPVEPCSMRARPHRHLTLRRWRKGNESLSAYAKQGLVRSRAQLNRNNTLISAPQSAVSSLPFSAYIKHRTYEYMIYFPIWQSFSLYWKSSLMYGTINSTNLNLMR